MMDTAISNGTSTGPSNQSGDTSEKMIMEGQNTGQLCRDRGKKNKYVRTNYVNTKVREYGGKELLQMIPLMPIPAAHR